MNEAKIYADGFLRTFEKQEEFLAFLKEIGRNSKWARKKSKDLRLIVLEKDGQLAEELKTQYAAEGMEEGIIEDTIRNTGLALKVKGQYYPVRDCAVGTILNRAGISGPALRKVGKNVYARILNDCLKVAKGEALLRISEGKVSAVLGGDSQDYAVLDMEQVYMRSVEYLNRRFSCCTYLGGFYEHHMASCLWELSSEDKLLDSYRQELLLHDREPEEMKPIIRITTSDTGDSGVNIFPMLLTGSRNDTIALGEPIRLKHKAGVGMKEFDDNLAMIYAKYEKAVSGLSALLEIGIQNPVNCMKGIMKRVNIPKTKYGAEAVALFEAQYGTDPCTAHEVFYGISEILYMLACDGEDGSKITAMEEKIARTLALRWEEFDIPGEIRW